MGKKNITFPVEKNRRQLVIFLTEKFLSQYDSIIKNSKGLNLQDKLQINRTFIEIVELAKSGAIWETMAQKYNHDFRDKFLGKILDSYGLLTYFEPAALITHGIGLNGFYTYEDFNALEEQELTESEFQSMLYFIRNNLHQRLQKIYQEAHENYNSESACDNINNSGLNNVLVDERIKGKLSKNEIEAYFTEVFSKKMKDNSPILSPEQIKHFLHANFSDFYPAEVVKKFDTPNAKQSDLRRILYKFYQIHSLETKTWVYLNLLKNNFCKFDNSELSSLKTSFSR